MSGRKTFTAGDVLTAADVQDYLMDQSVMVFAGTAARASAIASPTEGMVTYRTDDDVVETYDGSAWQSVAPADTAGLVLITSQSFSAQSSVSLNNCFTTTYDNYRIILDAQSPSANNYVDLRLRASSSDNSTSDYRYTIAYSGTTSATVTYQTIEENATKLRVSFLPSANVVSSVSFDIYSPQNTDFTRYAGNGSAATQAQFLGGMFVATTQFDGFTVYSEAASTISGTVRVYGYRD